MRFVRDIVRSIKDDGDYKTLYAHLFPNRALPDVKLIGVNNRDLHSFTTNTQQLFNCLPRIKDMYPDALIVAESGYQHSSDLTRLETEGVDAVLIGEGLAKNQHLIDFFLRDTGIKPTL